MTQNLRSLCPRTLTGTENVVIMLGKTWGKEVGKKEGDEVIERKNGPKYLMLDVVKTDHLDDELDIIVSSLYLVVVRTQYLPGIC